jgi:hypothetical protein
VTVKFGRPVDKKQFLAGLAQGATAEAGMQFIGREGRGEGDNKGLTHNMQNMAQSFPDGEAVKLMNPAAYIGPHTVGTIDMFTEARTGRQCGDFMLRTGDGEFAFYRVCGANAEVVRKAAQETKEKVSGSSGIKGIIEYLKREILEIENDIKQARLHLGIIKEDIGQEQTPEGKQAYATHIQQIEAEIRASERELKEKNEALQKFAALDQAIRQQPAV